MTLAVPIPFTGMRHKRTALFLLFGCVDLLLRAQEERINELRLLTGLNIGASMARIDSSSAPAFSTLPWPSLALDLGGSLTHRNKWGVSLMGSYSMSGYGYRLGDIEYDVYHTTPRVEGRAWWLFPFSPEHGTFLRVGGGFGYSFIGNDELVHSDDRFNAVSTSTLRTGSYISPEIGLSNSKGRHCFDLGLRYVRHLDREPAFTTVLTSDGGITVGSSTNDSFGLVIRYHIGFKQKPIPKPVMPAIAFAERRTDTLTTLSTQRDRISLDLWDNAEYDGDTISVLLNGRPVLVGFELTHKKKRVTIPIARGSNTLLIVAHNEGRVPPNTASCTLKRGKGREQLLIRTSQAANMAIIIEKE